MVDNPPKADRKCLYCGGDVQKERRGEHIIPAAIGGELTLKEVARKSVCQRCNNGILSRLDDELCRRSYLSIIASQELDAQLWQVWDVHHAARDLLVEARPLWEDGELKSLICYPQLTFEPRGPEMRGDVQELEQFGREHSEKVLTRAVYAAFQRFNSGKKGALHLERVRTDFRSNGHRFAPRVFTRHTISEIAKNIWDQSFILRYASAEDLRFALRSMSHMDASRKSQYSTWSQSKMSHFPTISMNFDMGLTLRAMLKIGVNLLAAYCSKTPVDCESFKTVTKLILGKIQPHPTLFGGNGFVCAAGIRDIDRPGCHSFRLTYLNGEWLVYSSYFGGVIGSAVSFPGPNREEWNTLDIVAPIKSRKWTVTPSQLYQPLKVQVQWNDSSDLTPTLKMQYRKSSILVEHVPAKNS